MNVANFPPMIKQQVFKSLPRAQEYAMRFMCADVYAKCSIIDTDDGQYIVTVFPHDDLLPQAVKNHRSRA